MTKCSCGFSRRGEDHDKGTHHKGQVSKARSKRALATKRLHGMKRNVGDYTDHEKTCNCFVCRREP